ncbi:acetolactate decarboxylase [Asaia platycodi]|uniref:acetolactate decarboxylase n=1 Tax=Asaia platycodi TaxID=610243 RepID=UPI000470E22F|nr:acetolactate decarboxylase [Asaia platycodi]
MSKITQFSTIGALMAGHFRGEAPLSAFCSHLAFGLGCSAEISGELTIHDGKVHEATAGEALHCLPMEAEIPFVQVTDFVPLQEREVTSVTHENAEAQLSRFIRPDNIFLAVSISGCFEHLVLRRPHRADGGSRSVDDVAAAQKVDQYERITGRLIGFWTPELFGRVSVPGFHFHFLDETSQISGHVLEFSAQNAVLSFEEKTTIEIMNPASEAFRALEIDVDALDEMIHRIEK